MKTSWGKKLQYYFDYLFSLGPGVLIGALALFTVVLSLITALVLVVGRLSPGGEPPFDFIEGLWFTFLASLGEGSVAGRESVWIFRFLTLGLTLASIFIVSNLIGIISNAISQKIENLRRGKSAVIERDHIVVLGWSEQVFTIIPQLFIAQEGKKNQKIVLLGNHDKVEMEDQIRSRIGAESLRKVVCRSGSPIEMSDLELTNLNEASGILVLTPEGENPDAEVIKTVLAITKSHDRRGRPFTIIASLREKQNRALGKIVGEGEVEWIYSGQVIARLLAQSCNQPGLSVVYSDLLDFTGDEIYFVEDAALIGRTYREALSTFQKGVVIGLQKGDRVTLNPPMESIIRAGDQLIVISSDEHGLVRGERTPIHDEWIVSNHFPPRSSESVIILGWSDRGYELLRELNNYFQPKSKVCIVTDKFDLRKELEEIASDFNIKISFEQRSILDRSELDRLKLPKYNHIILLSNEDQASSIQQIDSNTLFTLLHVRDIIENAHSKPSIATEILDGRNSRLAEVAKADDFIVSDRLISLMMAQIVADRRRNAVYEDLFNPQGSEIYLKPVTQYVKTGVALNFYTLLESAARKGETAIGYRLSSLSEDAKRSFGVKINPDKWDEVVFTEKDKVIVLAEK
ncbi:MAG: lipoprotein [Bellilinea sp.]|nr:MAG: lipoprotein [Bellilinea sp.]